MSGARFGTNCLLTLGLSERLPLSLQIMLLAAERADETGVAVFEDGELQQLLAFPAEDSRTWVSVLVALLQARRRGYGAPHSQTTAVRLGPRSVQPVAERLSA